MPASTAPDAQRFETLARLGQAVSASLDVAEVLDTVARAAIDLLPGSHAAIWVAEGERLIRRAGAGGAAPCGDECVGEIAVGEGLIGRAAALGEPVVVEDVRRDSGLGAWVRQHGYVSFLAMPLVVKEELVGVLSLGIETRHAFSLHEMEVLGAFGDQAAIAVGNARLYARLSARVRRLRTLTRLTRLISSSLDDDAVLSEIAEAANTLADARAASIWSADDATRTLQLVAASRGPMDDFPMPRMPYDVGVLGWVATRREAAEVPDVFTDPRFRALDWWRSHRLSSFLGIPVVLEDRLVAVLALNGDRPLAPTAEERDLLESFAAQAAVAIRNARLFTDSERRRRAAEALQRIGRDLAHSLDFEEVGSRVVDSVLGLIDAQRASLYRLDEDSGELVLLTTGGEAPPSNRVLPRGVGTVGLAAALRRPVACADVLADERITWTAATRAALETSPHRAVLAVPLLVRERLFGVLAIADRVGRAFTIDEVSLAQAFTDQAALALDNARLLHESRVRQARLETLLEVSRQLSGIQPLETVLGLIAEACGRVLDSGSVGFRVVEGDELVTRGVWGDAGAVMVKQRLKIGESLSGRVAATGQPLIVHHLSDSPDLLEVHREPARAHKHRSYLGVPVKIGERLVGVLSIRSVNERAFGEAEVATATAFAAQAAIAVQNASLYAEVQAQLQQTETLLNVTRAVSSTLDLTEAMRRVARETARLLRADMVGAYLADADARELRPMAGYRVPPALRESFQRQPLRLAAHPWLADAWHRRATVWSTDVEHEPGVDRELVERFAHRALLFCPMVAKGRSIGGLFVLWSEPRRAPGAEEIRLLEGLADQAALSIETARLYDQSERRRRAAEALLEVGQALASTLEPTEIFTMVTRRTAQAVGAERGSLYLARHGRLVPRMSQYADGRTDAALWGLFKSLPGYRPEDVPVYAEAVRTRRPVVVEDATAPEAGVPAEWVETFGIRSVLVVPLFHQNQLLGMLNFDTVAPNAWRQEQIDLAVTIANQTALAVANARLFAAQREEAEVAGALLKLARTLEPLQHVGAVLEAAAARTPEVLGLSRCGLLTVDPETGDLAPAHGVAPGPARPSWPGALRGLAACPALAEAVHSQDVVAVTDATEGTWIPRAMAEALDIRSMLVVPLVTRGRLMGVLTADTPGHATDFTDKQLTVARGVGAHVASALDRAELFAREQASQRFLQSTLDALPAHVAVVDEAGTIIAVNEAWRRFAALHRLGGRTYGVGDNYLSVCDGARGEGAAEAAAVAAAIRAVLQGARDEFHLEYDCHGPSERRWFVVRVTRFAGPGAVRAVVTHEDVSERRLAEDALRRNEEHVRQVQKMEAVGRLAGGIAHDFNNLLTVITGRTQLLLRRLREADPMRGDLVLIRNTVERASTLTRQLLAFSRKQVLQPRVVEVEAIVHGLETMLQRLLGEDIELVIPPAAAPSRVKADPGQLEQVIVNLAVNARDAMPQGGRLTMQIGHVDLDEALARRSGAAQPGPHVVLSVIDSGVGMDETTKARIFEPFFTTKGLGQGTGLGLATVYGIVQQHQGGLMVHSAPGEGTTFEVYLPATSEPAPVSAEERPSGLPAGQETILLVEDEAEVRALARDILQQLGYTVLEAADGAGALEICARYRAPIHLLLSDVIMPHMNGRELAERITQARPGVRILYTSGYTDDALAPRALLEADRALLQKPFTPEAFARKIRDVLDKA